MEWKSETWEGEPLEVERWNGETWEWHGLAQLSEDTDGQPTLNPGDGLTDHECGEMETALRNGQTEATTRGKRLRWTATQERA